tara:strand:- start:572 stop:961 length:390 start_codon:yes stop_codon:yes gene_type:complete
MASILVIEDDKTTRTLLEVIFKVEGHTVCTAPNGTAGLALFKARKPDIVFVDLFMPVKNGIEVIRALAAMNTRACFVAISGGGPEKRSPQDFLIFARQAGAHAALQKPLRKSELLKVVDELLTSSHHMA